MSKYKLHPGLTVDEIFKSKHISPKDFSRRTGIGYSTICSVISGRSGITLRTAQALYITTGLDVQFWMNLQKNYDEEIKNDKN